MNEVIANVSQGTRDQSHHLVDRLIESRDKEKKDLADEALRASIQLDQERDALLLEKSRIESSIKQIEIWRSTRNREIEKLALCFEDMRQAHTAVKDEVLKRKEPLVKQLHNIENRLRETTRQLRLVNRKSPTKPREDVPILLRIESLLAQILREMKVK